VKWPASISWLPGGLALFALTFALYAPSLNHSLVDLDDLDYIAGAPLVMEGFSARETAMAFTSFRQGMYAPLLWISYGLDARLGGATPGHPLGFHLTNILLHALNALLLYLLLLSWNQKPGAAFFFAAVWAWHPLRVESVAWVAERKDVLSGFLGLLSIAAYARAVRPRWPVGAGGQLEPPGPLARIPYLAAGLFFAAGLLVKPSLVPLPAGLLLLDVWPLRRLPGGFNADTRQILRLLAEKIPFLIMAILASAAAAAAHRELHALAQVPLATRGLAIPIHYATYLGKTFWPCGLAPLHPDIVPAALAAAIAGAGLFGITGAAWMLRRRHPESMIGWLWFLGFLFPAIGVVRFGAQSLADRFTYLPAIGLSIALLPVWRSGSSGSGRAMSRLRLATAAIVLAGLAMATHRLLPAWQSTETLLDQILRIHPGNPIGLSMQAMHSIQQAGDFASARAGFDRIIESGASNHGVIAGRARCLEALEGPAAAKDFLLRADTDPNPYAQQVFAWDLARYFLRLDQPDEAIRHAERALSLPSETRAAEVYLRLLLMVAAFEKGDSAAALGHARRFPAYADKTSLEFPDLLPYYLHQWIECRRDDAWTYFRRLIQDHPDRTGLLNNIVWGLATADWSPAPPGDVVALAQQICTAFPAPNPGALDTLAAAQANASDFPAAVQTVQEALDLLPVESNPHTSAFRERLLARQKLYRQNQPYREEAFSRLMAAQFGKGLPVTNRKAAP